MDLPTYTNIWRIEKRLYKLYDLRLPMPLPLVQIGVFIGVFVPWIVLLRLVGIPFGGGWVLSLYLVPPGVLTWMATRPVIEGKRLTELLLSQTRYLTEPRTWCRLTPIREPREVVIVARVWRRTGRRPASAAGTARSAEALRGPAEALHGPPEALRGPVEVGRPAQAGAAPPLEDHMTQPGTARRDATWEVPAPPSFGADAHGTAAGEQAGVPPVEQLMEPPPATPRLEMPPAPEQAPEAPDRSGEVRREQASARPVGSGKRGLASGVRRPGQAAEFWKAIAPPSQPDHTPASAEPATQEAPGEAGGRAARQPEATTEPDIPQMPGAFGASDSGEGTPDATREPDADEPSGSDRIAVAEPGTDEPGTDEPGAGKPGAGKLGAVEVSGSGEPAVTESGTGEPGAGKPGAGKLGAVEVSGSGEPAVAESGTDELDTGAAPGADGPAAGEPGADGPAAGEPGADEAGVDERATSEAAKEPPRPWSEELSRPQREPGGDARVWPPAKTQGGAPASKGQPPRQTEQQQQPASRSRPSGDPDGTSPWGMPPRSPATPIQPLPPDAVPDVRPEAQLSLPPAPAREVRSGPASPVRPRPLPLPPPPPPAAPAIMPPDPDQDGAAGGLRRLFQAVGGGHGQDESDYHERLQRPFHGTRRIVILGCTGGAGQTVTALMLGHTFAQFHGEPIAAIDINPGPGALARRTRSETHETLTALITHADQVNSLTAMRRYASRAKSGLDVIAAGRNPLQALDDRDYALAIRTVDRFYSVTMLDAAAAVVARVLPHADQIVLVAPASADAPRAVTMTFEWLDGHGYGDLRSSAVTVINGVSRRSMDDVEQAEAVARGRCRALVRIPWDDHLSLDRSPRNELKSLRAPTRRAYLALAGVVAGGFAALPERYAQAAGDQQQEASR